MEINIAEIAAQAIAFCALLIVLRWKAWGPIQNSLRLRREKIQSEFDKIDSAKKEIESLKAEYHAHLQKIEDDARAKLLEAVNEGRKISKEIQEKARLDSQNNFEKAKENLATELAKARVTLRREIADLALNVSEKVLQEQMKGAKQQEKILEMIEELDRAQ